MGIDENSAETSAENGIDEIADKINEAAKYSAMADKILLARFREKYYLQSLEILKGISGADTEQDPDPDSLILTVTKKLNEARAYSVVEKYEFACKSREYAKTSEDLGSAALHFKEAAEAREKTIVDTSLISGECLKKYQETAQAKEESEQCTKKAGLTYQVSRIKILGGLALVLVLLGTIFALHNTVTFRSALGKAELTLGFADKAVENYEKAWKRHASDETYGAYLEALRQAGMAAWASGKAEETCEYLHLPALEGDKECADIVTQAELSLLTDAEIGEKVTFGGCDWMVLDQADGNLLLVKYEAISGRAFQENTAAEADWENSSLRQWLNGEYLDENFNETERSLIMNTPVRAEDNPVYGTEAGNDTTDHIYLLSINEFENYAEIMNRCGHCYWLRSPGAAEGTAAFVDIEKTAMIYGYEADSDSMYVKPVMWISTNK